MHCALVRRVCCRHTMRAWYDSHVQYCWSTSGLVKRRVQESTLRAESLMDEDGELMGGDAGVQSVSEGSAATCGGGSRATVLAVGRTASSATAAVTNVTSACGSLQRVVLTCSSRGGELGMRRVYPQDNHS